MIVRYLYQHYVSITSLTPVVTLIEYPDLAVLIINTLFISYYAQAWPYDIN
jgi:hypothetical protein